ncbi:hypothetical protein METBIDRAFT_38680 [Metschnikowia bicuspidata var. bicuspidata NRRL YB-4993]|uniref:Nitrogen permease regulator 3 n=1 Tax=Metschnikowia bicuspidata var. bicuspidata NRRL YB-4993 TaxID=869754 RepID=A0A1A0HDS6_9ASCO|nr:hypothetical protein METBIDRAFT_38680 [Metschnikowia bicuspidata var. bicuspidata NRRL YB-4993]OBA22047.1 hypothetical protein METBIDRAFT_38680 [Metschnikowia bicuspidata var. bicuspidata NRRL YB-4993]
MSYNLPNPSFIGILLAVSTHNGPQIAFSYPDDLSLRQLVSRTADEESRSEDDDFDDEDFDAASSDEFEYLAGENQFLKAETSHLWDPSHPNYYLGTKNDLMTFLTARESYRDSTEQLDGTNPPVKSGLSKRTADSGFKAKDTASKSGISKPGQILGLEPDQLGEMLCPPRAMCNRRFDVMLENVVFLGLPVHVDTNGSWRAKKNRPAATGTATARSERQDLTESLRAGTAMSMFHLVFVMSPPDIERNYRVDEMFYNVTSKLSLMLRYEQQKNDFVWLQVRMILKLKDEFRASAELKETTSMTAHLLANLPLCRMMAECHMAISASQIANLNINGKPRSFQIPMKTEFHSLPEPTVPYIPGSCLLSTINCLGRAGLVNVGETTRYSNTNLMELLLGLTPNGSDPNTAEDDDDGINANPDDIVHLALLLCDDPEVIIKDIKAETHSALARFVHMIRPTESLLKIANSLRLHAGASAQLSVAEIKSLALHLVYWRRARVIPPLNTRGIYIVSPMAPISTNFHRDIVKFNEQFPTVPSLPLFLRLLSTRSRKPRQFASIIPSRDHKDMYISALAWLVRFGYVTQLHTYIWLKVLKKVKMKVEEELEEELGKAPKRNADGLRTKKIFAVDNKMHLAVDNSSKQTGPLEKATHPESLESVEEEIDKLQKRFEAHNSIPDLVLEDDGDTILVDPGRASSLERRWINKIIYEECGLSSELTAVFYKLLKYMNGQNSLELLLLRENISRSELRKLLLEIDEYVISVRHW